MRPRLSTSSTAPTCWCEGRGVGAEWLGGADFSVRDVTALTRNHFSQGSRGDLSTAACTGLGRL